MLQGILLLVPLLVLQQRLFLLGDHSNNDHSSDPVTTTVSKVNLFTPLDLFNLASFTRLLSLIANELAL